MSRLIRNEIISLIKSTISIIVTLTQLILFVFLHENKFHQFNIYFMSITKP